MRRLQHLPGVERVAVRVVVAQASRNLAEDGGGAIAKRRLRRRRKVCEALVELLLPLRPDTARNSSRAASSGMFNARRS